MKNAGSGFNDFTSKMDEMNKSIGAFMEAYDKAQNGINSGGEAWGKTVNQFKNLGIVWGDVLIPVLTKAGKVANILMAPFKAMPEWAQQAIAGIAMVVAAVGVAMKIFGEWAKPITKLFKFVGKGLPGWASSGASTAKNVAISAYEKGLPEVVGGAGRALSGAGGFAKNMLSKIPGLGMGMLLNPVAAGMTKEEEANIFSKLGSGMSADDRIAPTAIVTGKQIGRAHV